VSAPSKLQGVFSPALTPVDADLAPDPDRFVAHCRWLLAEGCHGLGIFGTTSEANSFSADERMHLTDALVAAAVNGWPDVVRWLLDHGTPLDALRPWGPFRITALHGAAWAGWPDVVRLLLERGADTTVVDATYGTTPRAWAEHCKRHEALAAFDEPAS